WAVELVRRRGDALSAGLMASVVGLHLLSGGLVCFPWLCCLLAAYCIMASRQEPHAPRTRVLATLGLAVAVRTGIAACQSLAALDFSRAGTASTQSSTPLSLLQRYGAAGATLLIPGVFGDAVQLNWWGPQSLPEGSFACGAVTLLMAMLALLQRPLHRTTLFW